MAKTVKKTVKPIQAAAQEAVNQLKAGIDIATFSGLRLLERLADLRLAIKGDPDLSRALVDINDANEAFENLEKTMDGLSEWIGILESRVKK